MLCSREPNGFCSTLQLILYLVALAAPFLLLVRETQHSICHLQHLQLNLTIGEEIDLQSFDKSSLVYSRHADIAMD